MKKFLTFFLSLLLIFVPLTSNAGFFKKGVKGYVASRIISKSIKKAAAKKVAERSVKGLATKNKSLFTKAENKAVERATKKAEKAKKKADKEEKSQGPLEQDELVVGQYKNLIKKTSDDDIISSTGNELDVHHIPSSGVLRNNGIDKREGIAVKMLKERHEETSTFGGRNKASLRNLPMRTAVAKDVKNFRNIYKKMNQKELSKNNDIDKYKANQKQIRDTAKEIIERNKKLHPEHFEITRVKK